MGACSPFSGVVLAISSLSGCDLPAAESLLVLTRGLLLWPKQLVLFSIAVSRGRQLCFSVLNEELKTALKVCKRLLVIRTDGARLCW